MQIIEELLDLSSMTAGNLSLSIAPIDLRDLIGGVVETIRRAADGKSIALHVSIDETVRELTGDCRAAAASALEPPRQRSEVHAGGRSN